MKNQYLIFSMLLTGIYAMPQLAVAQLLTQAHPTVESTASRHLSTPHGLVSQRSHRSRSFRKAPTELEHRFNINVAYDEQLLEANKAAPVDNSASASLASLSSDVVSPKAEAAIPITGRVLDETGSPLPGVTVVLKGTTSGTTTDAEGTYTLSVPDGNATLTFSFIGYTSQDVAVNNRSTVEVRLVPNATELNEVVVIGYQAIRKRDVTGANDVINPTEANRVTAQSLPESIQGLAPGVTVRNTGVPGQQSSIQIRGVASFLNTDPLYVIDGMIADANPTINSDDVESIQILKDASAAAIYGSRAANGVIIITTRQGKEGPARVSFSAKYGVQQAYKRWDVMNASQFAATQRQQYQNAGQTPLSSVAEATFNPNVNTDWQDQVLRTGSLQNYNINLSGGSKTGQYYISGSYFNNTGYVIGSNFNRASLRINTRSVLNRFTVGENLVLTNSNTQNQPVGTNPIYDMAYNLPVIPVQDPSYISPTNPLGYGIGSFNAVSYAFNPVAARDLAPSRTNVARLVGNGFIEYKFADWLSYRFNAGLDASFSYNQNLRYLGVFQYNASPVPTSVGEDRSQYRSFLFENTVNFNRTFGSHNINGVVGISQQTSRSDITSGSRTNLGYAGGQYFTTIGAATGISNSAGGTPDYYRILGYLGRINYTYGDRYLLTLTGRVDQDSRFGASNRTGFFPSVAAAWRISQEKFFHVDWISELKLSASYGKLGIVVPTLGSFPYTAYINSNPRAIFGTEQTANVGAYQAQLSNPDIQWEQRIQQNFGVTASFLNNRIFTEINVYNSLSSKAILNLTVPGYLGNLRGNPYVNTASIRNRGIEFAATYRSTKHDFKWNVSGNFTTIKNRVENVGNQGQGIDYIVSGNTRSQVGNPIGQWFVLKSNGLFQSQEDINNYRGPDGSLVQPFAKPGDIRYVDTNNDGRIDVNDRQFVTSPWPKLQAGAQFNGSYKSFSLNIQLVGTFGYTVYNDVRRILDSYQNTNFRSDISPWTPTNTSTTDPRLGLESGDQGIISNNLAYSDRWLENASYVRVRNVEIGYNLPKELASRFNLRGAHIYISGQNLFTITGYSGLDPDVTGANIQERGVDNGHWPTPRVLSIGINCDL